MEKRRRGRPRKEENTIKAGQFARAGMAMFAFDEARGRGDKHSAAVRYAVAFVKQRHPRIRFSESEMRRILRTWRPRGSSTILRFERSSRNEEEMERYQAIRKCVAILQAEKGPIQPKPPKNDLPRTATRISLRFAERPDYPRHNRKNPKG